MLKTERLDFKTKTLVDQYLEEVADLPDDGSTYLVIYSTGKRPPKEFYHQLRRLAERNLITKIATGTILCKGRRAVMVVKKLIERYGKHKHMFKVVKVFRVLEEVM